VPTRLVLLAALAVVGCGGAAPPQTPAPATAADALARFLDAVRTKDYRRMGQVWGSERGPAAERMNPKRLDQRVQTMAKYLGHSGYVVLSGPEPVPGSRTDFRFHVELRRPECVQVVPIDVTRLRRGGGWLVVQVDLEQVTPEGRSCAPRPGTPR
jgi:hypothetical protein